MRGVTALDVMLIYASREAEGMYLWGVATLTEVSMRLDGAKLFKMPRRRSAHIPQDLLVVIACPSEPCGVDTCLFITDIQRSLFALRDWTVAPQDYAKPLPCSFCDFYHLVGQQPTIFQRPFPTRNIIGTPNSLEITPAPFDPDALGDRWSSFH